MSIEPPLHLTWCVNPVWQGFTSPYNRPTRLGKSWYFTPMSLGLQDVAGADINSGVDLEAKGAFM